MRTERILATAQIALSIVFTVGYFYMLHLFFTGNIRTPVEWRDQLSVLLGVLTTGEILILNFWFTRSRQNEAKET